MADTLRELLAAFDIEVDDRRLQSANTSIGGAIAGLRTLGSVLMGAAIVQGFVSFVRRSVEAGSQLHDTSRQIGISTDALQRWQFAARMSGVSSSALTTAFGRLQRSAVSASEGSGEARDAFERLGVAVRGADGQLRSGDALMLDAARGLARMENATERAAVAQRIFGRGGAALLPLFADGEEGIARLAAEFDALGGGLSRNFIEQADELGDNLDRWDLAFEGLRSTIGMVILPVLTKLVTGVIRVTVGIKRFLDEGHRAEALMITLGAAALVLGVKFLAGFAVPLAIGALVAVVIGLIALAVDDLLTFMSGGQSVIGEFFQTFLGNATTEDIRWGLNNIPLVVEQTMESIVETGREGWKSFTASAKDTGQRIGRAISGAIVGVVTFVRSAIGLFQGFAALATTYANIIGDVFTATWQRIVGGFRSALGTVTGGLQSLAGRVGIDLGLGGPAAGPGVTGGGVVTAAPRGGTTSVRVQSTTPITIHAPAANAQEVVDIARREAGASAERDRRAAAAALAQAAGGG
ncbi:MAG: phage tail tape measure protein [Polyangiaceae bacterium]|nr:phage tail tape measure protein [Polyangiaceae bacterium]